jgi:magnesium chelatase subunit D
MKPITYPFAAIVGQEQMKLALLLAAIDWRLGVLLRGDKGAGKTTTARGLAMLLPEPAPFVNLPIGVTEDRLLGGLHLESTLKGNPVLKRGLLSEAHGGVLYIDEVNLLPAHLSDALLDAASSGVNVVEREGFSVSHSSEFVLLGSMNPEEGLLRPQLLDRFALAVDIAAPLEAEARQEIVERRIAFERDVARFADEWSDEQEQLRRKIAGGRDRASSIQCSSDILAQIGTAICAAGVRSLRADLAAVRASIACAALMADSVVKPEHVDAVLPLVLNHRAKPSSRSIAAPPSTHSARQEPESADKDQSAKEAAERVFAPQNITAPAIHSSLANPLQRGNSQTTLVEHPGPVVHSRRTETPRELDLRATLNHAVLETGSLPPRLSDLHEKVRDPRSGVRYLFLIDSSGSHAAQEKMRLVKGAILGMLNRSFRKGDEIVFIAFRGTDARVLLEPCQQIDDAATALEYLPTGGRTPLAHALELAKTYLTPATLLIVLSDGRANVAVSGGDPWQEALERAAQLNCRALVIDTEDPAYPVRRVSELADALRASSVDLFNLEHVDLLQVSLSTTLRRPDENGNAQ